MMLTRHKLKGAQTAVDTSVYVDSSVQGTNCVEAVTDFLRQPWSCQLLKLRSNDVKSATLKFQGVASRHRLIACAGVCTESSRGCKPF